MGTPLNELVLYPCSLGWCPAEGQWMETSAVLRVHEAWKDY